MNKTLSLLAVSITLMVLFAGCTTSQQKSPKELFKELSENASLPNGKFTYISDAGIYIEQQSDTPTLLGQEFEEHFYILNGSKKYVSIQDVEWAIMETSIFEVEGEVIYCTTTTYSETELAEDGPDVMCIKDSEQEAFSYYEEKLLAKEFEEYLDKIDLTQVGEKTSAGRSCYDFLLKIDAETMEEIAGSQGSLSDFTRAEYNICLDKEYGFTSYSETTLFVYNEELGSEVMSLTHSQQLTDYDPNGANPSDFEIPSDT